MELPIYIIIKEKREDFIVIMTVCLTMFWMFFRNSNFFVDLVSFRFFPSVKQLKTMVRKNSLITKPVYRETLSIFFEGVQQIMISL